jgi:hypothetical protein
MPFSGCGDMDLGFEGDFDLLTDVLLPRRNITIRSPEKGERLSAK